MQSIPLMFGAVTGLALTALGALLASSGIAGWGLFTVGLGILAVAVVSRFGRTLRSVRLVGADPGSHSLAQQR